MNEWQPIETAPKDGSHILIYERYSRVKITGGYWDNHKSCKCWIAGGYMRKTNPPTHWLPLPKEPNAN